MNNQHQTNVQLISAISRVPAVDSSDTPSSTDLYWDDGNTWTPMGVPSNLTCYSSRSYPPASFRWFRGSTELTRYATRVTDEDNSGMRRQQQGLVPNNIVHV